MGSSALSPRAAAPLRYFDGVPGPGPQILFASQIGWIRIPSPHFPGWPAQPPRLLGRASVISPERQRANWIRKSFPPRCGQGWWWWWRRKLRVFPGLLKPGLLCPEQTSSRNLLLGSLCLGSAQVRPSPGRRARPGPLRWTSSSLK